MERSRLLEDTNAPLGESGPFLKRALGFVSPPLRAGLYHLYPRPYGAGLYYLYPRPPKAQASRA